MTDNLKYLAARFDCHIAIERLLAGRAQELIASVGCADKQLLLVCDSTTYEALGKRVAKELNAPFLIFEGRPSATVENVDAIHARKAEAIIAVGSGTINDLCKYASFLSGIPYAVFPTAPSMNGYCSANASITLHDHKQTLSAHLPKGVFCDLDVLAAAPKRLIRSGLGDSLCRPTAQADWLLSHLLFATPYDPEPFTLLAPYEQELFSHADKLVSGDIKIIELLITVLLISGFGMVIAKGSYPASQGEHLIAHTMEMKHGEALPETYHGEQIGVTTLFMAAIQHAVLGGQLRLHKLPAQDYAITEYFGAELGKSVSQAYQAKQVLYDRYDAINEHLLKESSFIRDKINEILLPEPVLSMALQKAGAPATADALGWNNPDLELAARHAKFIRNRFTFLDLAY